MSDETRLAIVGCRNNGVSHIRRASKLEDVSVVAAADTDPARLEVVREEFGIERLHEDAAEVFSADDVDGVVLSLPNHLHAPMSIQALDAGKHVLVEKPMAHSSDACREMIAARDRSGKTLMVGYNQRFWPQVPAIRKGIADGEIGDIVFARAWWNRRPSGDGKRWGRGAWMDSRATSGGGPLVDIGVHKLDFALYVMGFPKVTDAYATCAYGIGAAAANEYDRNYEQEDLCFAVLRLANGATLHLEASYFLNDYQDAGQAAIVYGTRGGFRTGGPKGTHLFRVEKGENVEVELHPDSEWPCSCVEHFVRVLRGEQELVTIPEQGLAIQEMVEAIYESSDTGQPVKLNNA